MPMQPPLRAAAPSFYLTGRQSLRPGVILLATLAVIGALSAILYALGHTGRMRFATDPAASATSKGASDAGEKDDPSQIDTIVLGDPADAPVPGRKGDHVSSVHPTILVRLPRFGDEVGLIPDTAPGHLLYGWLAAFNQANYPALAHALPNVALASAAAQMELRKQTGGFNLLSAKEIAPGVLVFRLRDQTPSGNETLGTLQMRGDSKPPTIASLSLRAIAPPGWDTPKNAASVSAGSPR